MIPRVWFPTRSMIRQSTFCVSGLSRRPLPIIWMKRFCDLVGRARRTQSIAGKSAPSVRIPART